MGFEGGVTRWTHKVWPAPSRQRKSGCPPSWPTCPAVGTRVPPLSSPHSYRVGHRWRFLTPANAPPAASSSSGWRYIACAAAERALARSVRLASTTRSCSGRIPGMATACAEWRPLPLTLRQRASLILTESCDAPLPSRSAVSLTAASPSQTTFPHAPLAGPGTSQVAPSSRQLQIDAPAARKRHAFNSRLSEIWPAR